MNDLTDSAPKPPLNISESVSAKHKGMHLVCILLVYFVGIALSMFLLLQPAANKDFVTTLSSGAIMATFGSALMAVAAMWAGDNTQRIELNIDILFSDILKLLPWRRWPFLPRLRKQKLLDGSTEQSRLVNPIIPFNVGTHNIKIIIPTVFDDFFDLPLITNLYKLIRFKNASRTYIATVRDLPIVAGTELSPMSHNMAYECLLDTWTCILVVRLARYLLHFGIALTVSSSIIAFVGAMGHV